MLVLKPPETLVPLNLQLFHVSTADGALMPVPIFLEAFSPSLFGMTVPSEAPAGALLTVQVKTSSCFS